ncbi:hypothetical protein GXN76_01565 [Kroppenstedtia pulmonis]|uniref:Uncharacterized protein n=1 Tax=Kroppenstedtia pulmonis TaxID=1380685 RepID=A0A7D3XZ14_9BACL|nr:hypothetical protein [Kroppenstedtia pulmonis]QKG83280.1 hypothetical protein GXN76_01565 [Kroppenstedtia pulmonis]
MSINNEDRESEILDEIIWYDKNLARHYKSIQQLNHEEKAEFRSLVQRLYYLMEQEENALSPDANRLAVIRDNLHYFLIYILSGFITGISLVKIFAD